MMISKLSNPSQEISIPHQCFLSLQLAFQIVQQQKRLNHRNHIEKFARQSCILQDVKRKILAIEGLLALCETIPTK